MNHLPPIMRKLNFTADALMECDGFSLPQVIDGLRAYLQACEIAAGMREPKGDGISRDRVDV